MSIRSFLVAGCLSNFWKLIPLLAKLEYGHLSIANILFQILLASKSPVAAAYDATVWISVPGGSAMVDCLACG